MTNFVRVKRIYPGRDSGHEVMVDLDDIVYAEPFGEDGEASMVRMASLGGEIFLEIAFRAICVRLKQDPDFPL